MNSQLGLTKTTNKIIIKIILEGVAYLYQYKRYNITLPTLIMK